MDGQDQEKETNKKNTEYIPTKCRVTRPPPPKPATNPLQFVKVAPCPLFVKAQEQIKKVEQIKKERKEIRDESEDWQANLDNWKSSRRKQQEHIIERVVEVKKLTEQEENERSRRKSKTFSEMMEERNSKGRPTRFIPIYNDDESNDLSDYGIGSSSSKANSIKDVDTDDSSSLLDGETRTYDSPAPQKDLTETFDHTIESNISSQQNNKIHESNSSFKSKTTAETPTSTLDHNKATENYTYEGAIQDYRFRIQSKIKVDESIFTKHSTNKSRDFAEAQVVVPKGEISKRKGIFELEKPLEINHMESNTSRRLSEDFVNAISIKDRLKSLEKSTDQTIKCIDKSEIQLSVKQRLQQFNKQIDNANTTTEKPKPNKVSNYLLDNCNSSSSIENQNAQPVHKSERCSSPETEIYYNKLNMFNRDLDNLMGTKSTDDNNGEYPLSLSSSELTNVFSDREDSGIHTTDVSCSVSQADETIDSDLYQTIPKCIKNLTEHPLEKHFEENIEHIQEVLTNVDNYIQPYTQQELILYTKQFLDELIKDATENIWQKENDKKTVKSQEASSENQYIPQSVPENPIAPKNVIYENIEITPLIENIPVDFISVDFSLNGKKLEPPKAKPPPPPPPEDEKARTPKPVKRLNSTKRIKKEINIKRTSFLGIEDSTDMVDPDTLLEKPPDINTFLQKESKLEKSLYRKIQEESRSGILSKVESQDSGLDIDRGRLSSDTWCSSIGDSSTPSHERQDSEHTSSLTSEEDEISKKEREIIELVEKEEKSKKPESNHVRMSPKREPSNVENQFYPKAARYFDEQDSEVLKVEQELMQLEQEELKRQKENILFHNRKRLQNRHSLENICDDIYSTYANPDYRKSMPELQNMPFDFRKSYGDVASTYYSREKLEFGKSMPDIQHAYQSPTASNNLLAIDYRKSMPELQQNLGFKSPINRQPIMPNTKPMRTIQNSKPRILTKPSLKALSAVPLNRPSDNWIQPKANPEQKHYNQHWVFQEAELRRLNDQQQKSAAAKSWQQQKQDKPLPDSIIQTLTNRVQNRVNINDRNHRRSESNLNNNDIHNQPIYVNQPIRHSMPTVPYTLPTEDKMLSVSGKKKCSYCTNELGRGAAMIIESLCLFYHMECFKCCVCHIQLGDGRMGTDVRVRNQKLHCHNCYSSDDGVKFSCV